MAAVVKVQEQDFDIGVELAQLRLNKPQVGAVASFVGTVRELADDSLSTLTLEHYPGMTEASLNDICAQAEARWSIIDTLVIHRYGALHPQDQIVLVAVTSAHRGAAFAACEFIMDFLKTSAPFWKKETTTHGEHWVEARDSDEAAAERWKQARKNEGNDR